MLYVIVIALPVIFSVLILLSLGVVLVIGRVSAVRSTNKAAREFTEWMDTVDTTVGIAELLREK